MHEIRINRKHWPLLFLQKTDLVLRYGFSVDSPEDLLNGMVFRKVKKDFENLAPFLPKAANRILDIGCGLGLINIFFHEHYNNNENYWLLDRSDIEEEVFNNPAAGGWHSLGGFYSCNKLESTEEVLRDNGIDFNCITLIEGESQKSLEGLCDIDLVVSLQSWGFHYPLETYLEKVYDIMSTGGVMIIDIRDGTGGSELLESIFESVIEANIAEKSVRVVCMK